MSSVGNLSPALPRRTPAGASLRAAAVLSRYTHRVAIPIADSSRMWSTDRSPWRAVQLVARSVHITHNRRSQFDRPPGSNSTCQADASRVRAAVALYAARSDTPYPVALDLEPHLLRWVWAHVAQPQVQHLLHPGAGVEHSASSAKSHLPAAVLRSMASRLAFTASAARCSGARCCAPRLNGSAMSDCHVPSRSRSASSGNPYSIQSRAAWVHESAVNEECVRPGDKTAVRRSGRGTARGPRLDKAIRRRSWLLKRISRDLS